MTTAISASGLVKTYGRTRALDGLDFSVATGEVHGYLGPNGAGKTTTLRVLLGMLRATSGQVRLLDGDPWADAVRLHKRLAYVPGDVTLWPNLTGGEIIDLLMRLRGDSDTRRRDELIQRFDLDPSKKAQSYSKGNRQKVGLIAALASDTELLLLDEPTSGLDPLMEAEFRKCVAEKKRQGHTVLLSSHILSEVEVLCDRVSIIRRGRIVESGKLSELRHLTSSTVTAELDSVPPRLAGLPGVADVEIDGSHVRCQVSNDHIAEVLAKLTSLGLRAITVQPATLEEIFLRHYQNDEPADEAAGARKGR